MGADRHESDRRSITKTRTKRRYNGPPKDVAWCWITNEMIISAAFRALSGNALKILMRVAQEHMAHGGTENGKLLVTHKQFAAYGMRLASVADAIREAEYYGFIDVDRGMAYRGGHEPNLYRLTWLGDYNDHPSTNRWKGITAQHIAVWLERRTDKNSKKTAGRSRARQMPGVVIPLRGG